MSFSTSDKGPTSTSARRAPAPDFSPSLAWLLHPVSTEDFLLDYWETKPLVVRRQQPAYYRSLFSLEEVDRVLTTLDRRYPDIVLKNAAKEITPDDYTIDGEVLDVAKLYQLFHEGSTVALAFLDTVVPSLTAFCRALETEFSCPFQTNIYMTPPSAQGAKPHYDTHDVFVLQVSGSKKWIIYGTPVELPLSGQDFDAEVHPLGAPTMEFELHPGDLAYLPRGVVHEARSTDEISLHITAGALRYTWTDLLLEYIAAAALEDPAFRKALPPGFTRPDFDRSSAKKIFRDLLQRLSAGSHFDAAIDSFVEEFISASPPFLPGQMAQLSALESLHAGNIVGVRPGSAYQLRVYSDSLTLSCYGRKIIFPSSAAGAVRFALQTPRFLIRDLPGNLDDAGKLTLVRRLIREGLLQAL